MTAEELLVERYIELEKENLNKQREINRLLARIEEKDADIDEYQNLVGLLSENLVASQYGVSIVINAYDKGGKEKIQYLKNYFDFETPNETVRAVE